LIAPPETIIFPRINGWGGMAEFIPPYGFFELLFDPLFGGGAFF